MSRIFTAFTPLGDSLKFLSLKGREEMSRLFDITLALASLDNSIPMNALLGESVTVEVEREDRSKRYFNGCVTEFRQVKRDGRYFLYEARLRPQLWYLTQTRDFRIFQKMTARDIVKRVLSEFGIAVKDKLTGRYRMRDYTVQYGESAFDFISRLLEEEGAGYWFEHSMGSHVMTLSDSIRAYAMLPSHATIPYYPEDMAGIPDQEFVRYWSVFQVVNPGKLFLNDYDFKKPRANLNVIQPKPRDHAHNRYEIYQFPGGYREVGDGENYARLGIEELQTNHERADGSTNVRGIAPGYRFNLFRCPRADQNREYLIVRADYHWVDNSYEGGAGSKVVIHDTHFNVQPTSDPYRPERITPYPKSKGPDSAIVTGPKGQELWVDSYGRVKVQFHWDRYGTKDENSSCWVRIGQPWAGSNFGAIHLPRIGQEVLIEYINENPDHPIITSRLYNADNMPPWKLPQNATQSGVLTRSTKDGGYDNANAIRFEDRKGKEELWIRAEKDHRREVENNEKIWVGNDREKTIDRDETSHIKRDRMETVDRDESITVRGKRTEIVDGSEDVAIHDNRKKRVDLSEKISIGNDQNFDVGGNRSKNVSKNEKDVIGKNWSIKVGKFKTETISFASMQNVGLGKMTNVGLAYNRNVGGMMLTTVGMSRSDTIGQDYSQKTGNNQVISVGKVLQLKAGEAIELICGKSIIKLDKEGNIYLNGSKVEIDGTEHIGLGSKRIDIN